MMPRSMKRRVFQLLVVGGLAFQPVQAAITNLYNSTSPGISFSGLTPASVAVPTNRATEVVQVTNTTTTDLYNVECTFYSYNEGITVSGAVRVAFGTLTAGASATGTIYISVLSNVYASAQVPIGCDAYARGAFMNSSARALGLVSNAVIQVGTNSVTVISTVGVLNWLGQRLAGDGSATSPFYQVIDAGTNGVIDAPQANGLPGGDDHVLYSSGENLPVGRFGAVGVSANGGLFNRAFLNSLPAGRKIYVRAWDGPTFDRSVAYGDSSLSTLTSATSQSFDFGRWTVGTPSQPNRDWNGDGIPDGWCVTHGMDPRATVSNPPPIQVLSGTTCSRSGYQPIRVEGWSNWIYVLYQGSAGGLVEVRDTQLAGAMQAVTQVTGSGDLLKAVAGMAIDHTSHKLLVAEATYTKRIVVYDLNPTNGTLSYSMNWANTLGDTPSDIAVDGAGSTYIADSGPYFYQYAMDGTPLYYIWTAQPPTNTVSVSFFGDNFYLSYNDSSLNYNIIERFTRSTFDGPYLFGNAPSTGGIGLGDLKQPSKVFEGLNGRLYVTDTYHNRIQIFDANGNPIAVLPVASTNNISAGSALGQFNRPRGIWAVATKSGQHTIYVADTANSRVQRLDVCLDVDGDGMDDTWEDLNAIATDTANADPDHDNLTNLGEYRLAQSGVSSDPNAPNATTNLYFYSGGSSQPAGAPPGVTNVTVSTTANGVNIIAWYDRSPTSAAPVTISLSGGAYLSSAVMTWIAASNAYSYAYTTQPGDGGLVNARISGTLQTPMVYDTSFLLNAWFILRSFALSVRPALTNQPVIATTNEAVTMNAFFSATPNTAQVHLTDAVGSTLTNAAMTIVGTNATCVYPVPRPLTEGWVTVTLNAADASTNVTAQRTFAMVWPRIQQVAVPPPSVTWSTVTGIPYQVKARTNLTSGTWALLSTTNLTSGTNAVFTDRMTITTQQFYRIEVPR